MLRLPDSEEQGLSNSAAPAQQRPLLGTCGSDVPALLYMVSASLRPRGLYSWRRQWHPNPVLLPGKSHGPRSLVGCSPQGC